MQLFDICHHYDLTQRNGVGLRFLRDNMERKRKEKKSRTSYSTDGKGRWRKRTTQPQCSESVWFSHDCQGVKGHKGVHWCFSEAGHFLWDDNEDDPTEGGMGSIPPDHKHYRTPLEMQKEQYHNYFTDVDVDDPEELALLESQEKWHNEPKGPPPIQDENVSYFGPYKPEKMDKEDREKIEARREEQKNKKYGKPKTDKSEDHL